MDIFSLRAVFIIVIILLLAILIFLYIRKSHGSSAAAPRTRDLDSHVMGPLFNPEGEQDPEPPPPDLAEAKSSPSPALSEPKSYSVGIFASWIKRGIKASKHEENGNLDIAEGQKSANSPQEKDTKDETKRVIALCLRARKAEGFNGKMLLSMFQRFDLKFGNMDVFHRLVPAGGKEEEAFSVINGEEPGTLRPDDLETANTKRIIFFIALSENYNPLKCFDEMLKVAKQFAVSMDGALYDDRGSILSEQNITYHRDIIKDFLHSKKVKSARER